MVGAISPHPARPAITDPQIASFASDAAGSDHGLVLASFGSNSEVFGGLLNLEDFQQLALAFADLAPVSLIGV